MSKEIVWVSLAMRRAVEIADRFAPTSTPVLLVGTDVHTALYPLTERTWDVLEGRDPGPLPAEEVASNSRWRHLVVLFGDAAGAMVFRASREGEDGRGILATALYGEGNEKDILFVPGVGSARRPWVTPSMIEEGATVPVMDGRKVFRLAVTRMPEATVEVLGRCGYSVDDVDLLVMHQANLRINEAAQKALGLPDSKACSASRSSCGTGLLACACGSAKT